MTIAFQFAFEIHLQDNVASMARQYVRSIIASVQRVALALSPSRFGSNSGFRPPPGTPEAQTLAGWICQSYRWVTRQNWLDRTNSNLSNKLILFMRLLYLNSLSFQVLSRRRLTKKWRKWVHSQISLASLGCYLMLLFEGIWVPFFFPFYVWNMPFSASSSRFSILYYLSLRSCEACSFL